MLQYLNGLGHNGLGHNGLGHNGLGGICSVFDFCVPF